MSVVLSSFGVGGASSTKDLVISILSEQWPLSAKEISLRICKESNAGVSYQAVHKLLLDLSAKGILSRQGKSFELNGGWLLSQKSFFERVAADYLESKDRYALSPNFEGRVKLHFSDYTKFVVTIAAMFKNKVMVGNNPRPGIGIVRHAHWPLRFSFEDFNLLKDMIGSNAGGYALVKKDTPLDRWVVKQYLKGGFDNVVIIPKLSSMKEDLVIHGDGIMQIEFSPETMAILDEIYSKTENLTSLFKEFVKNTFSKSKVSIDVVITKNPALAKTLQAHFMAYFDKG